MVSLGTIIAILWIITLISPIEKVDSMGRILMVDDEESILFAFKKVLSAPSVTVDTAQTFAEALKLLQLKSYSAVIADLRLTGAALMEGFEVVREAKRMQTDCRVIVLTAYGENDTREKVFKLGADFYLEKPISPQKIKELLQSMGVLAA
jgi:DNA-binding response OmpR family regulator